MNVNHRFLKKFECEIIPLYKSLLSRGTLKNSHRICNFYSKYDKSPYLPVGAHGPWIITDKQKIVYDVGGYGMLGFGHNPSWLLHVLSKPHVMANVMTPSYEQENICKLLSNKTNYDKFAFLNSGSEGIEFTLRYVDRINKMKMSELSKSIIKFREDSNQTLFKLYDPLLMPIELRRLHDKLDKLTLKIYGLSNDATEPEIMNELFKLRTRSNLFGN